MVMLAPPGDAVNVQTVGVAVGASVKVRPPTPGSVTVRAVLRPGSATPEKSAPSSAVAGSRNTPLPLAPTKTLILPLGSLGSAARSRTSVTQRCRTAEGTEPLVPALLPLRYSVRLVKPSP